MQIIEHEFHEEGVFGGRVPSLGGVLRQEQRRNWRQQLEAHLRRGNHCTRSRTNYSPMRQEDWR